MKIKYLWYLCICIVADTYKKLINSHFDRTATLDKWVFNFMKEIFKDIPGYEGIYHVSNFGNVKSLKFEKETILKSYYNSGGYLQVSLWKNKNRNKFTIHILVALAFMNHITDGTTKLVIDHIDNNKNNNSLNNLQIISHRENISKDRKSGTSKYIGVYWDRASNKWKASIGIEGKVKHLGYFENEIDASNAYQFELKKLNKKSLLK